MFKYADKYIAALIKGIFNGTITEHELPESLYNAIADYLRSGLYKGFGSTLKNVPEGDKELLNDLRENIYMFSAAKTYAQVKEMTEEVSKPFNEFKKAANEIFNTYNKDYLKTEYDTAIGQGMEAVRWNDIEKQKDILPYLKYSAIGDACNICEPLEGLTAKVDDPIWDEIAPLNHFNCRCIVEQYEEAELTPDAEKDRLYKSTLGKMNDVFKMNAGKDGYVFKPDHPYFSVAKGDKGFAQNNFNLPIPKHD